MTQRTFLLLLLMLLVSGIYAKQVKLLTIGNSFSEDAVENYLADLVAANGDTIIIGNMYIPGCSLERHYNNSQSDATDYSYRKITGGKMTTTEKYTLRQALEDEVWDYVSFQQVSHLSGMYHTYFPYLDSLIVYARKYVRNPDAKVVLHATWAYSQDSSHEGFANYGNNQTTMFNAIVNTTHQVACTIGAAFIVPTGVAIQNGRTSVLKDTFCRDGFHLELTYGRYTAACTWFEKLFGISAIGSRYVPESLRPLQAGIAQYAAHYAVRNPQTVTDLGLLK